MPVSAPGLVQDDELVGSWFDVSFDNKISGSFQEIGGLGVDIEVVEITDAAKDTTTRKRPGTTKYSEVTLKRTLSADKSFWNWVKSIRDGKRDFRTNGAINVYDMGGELVASWEITNVWPSKWSASDLDVGSDDLMQEDVTLQCEQLRKVK